MKVAPITKNESERLQALYRYQIMDTEFEKEFDDLIQLASHICDAPISLMSLVAEDRQWFKAKVGMDVRETPREVAFCAHAIHKNDLFVVKDAALDERFHDNPLVTGDDKVRFYAGIPLTTPDGFNLGTLCVMDKKPRELNEQQKNAIKTIGAQVIAQMELKMKIQLLDQEKELITQKNKAITDSIRYAQHIQQAMQPPQHFVDGFFNDFFLINKPRDIIGGDFYWMTEVGHKKIVIVADCTGHGVPGAMMSMLGNTLLRDIVDKEQETNPEKILFQLDTEIAKVLNQQLGENRDGMDMSVVVIDPQQETLNFAGANHKMIYIQNGETFIISGDRFGIGGNQRRKTQTVAFSNYTVDISGEETPAFYLFTDGFRDQFGGQENKKFSLSRLASLLGDICQKSCGEQHQILSNTLKSWMSEAQETQTDDILLLGFRPKVQMSQDKTLVTNVV
ncbi:hypothetical protein BKI52_26570 [marine bacterium AO1-C]|nr:hypothetical protein BKI52_26570 [marine bacterium AO1-C]